LAVAALTEAAEISSRGCLAPQPSNPSLRLPAHADARLSLNKKSI